jgi:hypothetical protein
MRQHPPALETVKEYSSMSIYTYKTNKVLCEIFNTEYFEYPSISDQELSKLPEDSILGGTDYVSGLIWITDGKENSYIDPRESIPEGWRKGRTFEHGVKKDPQQWANNSRRTAIAQWSDPVLREKTMLAMRGPRKQKTCPHCGLVGAGGNMNRYHFNNCKVVV